MLWMLWLQQNTPFYPIPRVLNRAAKVAKKIEMDKEFPLDAEANFNNLDEFVVPLSMRTQHGQDLLLGGGAGSERVYVFGRRDHFDVFGATGILDR